MLNDYEFIPVDKNLIPYRFDIAIGGKTFTMEINYNSAYDFFTVDLLRNGETLVYGEKIVYGKLLFDRVQYLDIPETPIIPYDLSGNETRVTWNNLNETVFLWAVSINV